MSSTTDRLRILQVSTYDVAGGAEKIAWQLFDAYRQRGCSSWLAVGQKRSSDPGVLVVPNETNIYRLPRLLRILARPRRSLERWLGVEDFYAPGARRLLTLPPEPPDVVHCHNLHSPPPPNAAYFDLRVLPWLSRQVPVVLTLHDAWLLTGHCAHSFDCERWRTGCRRCPDLSIYPALRRNTTAYNFRRKRRIYAGSRLHISTPCRWLMDKVQQSMLRGVEYQVIPNGVDLTVFRPADQKAARLRLGLPPEAGIVLFVGHQAQTSLWRDYPSMRESVARAAASAPNNELLFICLGERRDEERIGAATIRFDSYQPDPARVADYYQAADVYLHASRADTFPTAVLEALACGTPVVATSVGGIPEQVEHGQTGFLVPPGNVEEMAARITQILTDRSLRGVLSQRAVESARQRFDLQHQADKYLAWYRELVASFRASRPARNPAAQNLKYEQLR